MARSPGRGVRGRAGVGRLALRMRMIAPLLAGGALVALVASIACASVAAQGAASGALTPIAGEPAPVVVAQSAGRQTAAGAAVRRAPVVVIDPGHAVDEVGAAAYGVVEKDSNLDLAFRVAEVLRTRGVQVMLTRAADVRAAAPGDEPTQELGYNGTRLDLQARLDLANAAQADLFVSLHSNGAPDPDVRGHEVYYNSARPFAAESRVLAGLLLDGVTSELRAAGYPATPRGVLDDACLKAFQGRCFPLFLLGPSRVTDRDEVYRRGGTPEGLGFAPDQPTITSRPSGMPGALVELLFISSPDDAAMLRDEGARNAMARGVARGVAEFLAASKQGG